MAVIEIHSLDAPGVAVYHRLTDHQLRNRLHPDDGIIIVESPKVISVALDEGLEPLSLLCEARHIEGDAAPLIRRLGDIPVYTGSRELLASLTGYTLTRGVLCAMRRPKVMSWRELCGHARRLVVIKAVCDTTNIGAIFRSAAALGLDAVLLSNGACDPLNRRAIRVSMGTVFAIPFARIGGIDELHALGFKSVAMALRHDNIPISSPLLKAESRLAIVVGTEGDGLSEETISAADYVARIPMREGVDSLNVGAAAAIAFWELAS